jgi:tRNA(Arg) A34 adenosine deaminase TadA
VTDADQQHVNPADEDFLRRAIELAGAGVVAGGEPYGSLLVGAGGDVLAESFNTVGPDRDISAHPELKLAVWAARELDAATAGGTTMYTSCQPCGMCAGAIARSGLGRVVFALSNEQYAALNPSEQHPEVPQVGPALLDEARVPIERFYS